MARIVIDAGHGGTARAGNSSAYGSRGGTGLLEKDVTLDIARHVVARLGRDAALTRTGDSNLPLGARAAHVSRDGADIFVSIHANSGPPEMSGPETWVHPEAGEGSHRLAGGIQRALERLGGRLGGSAESRRGPMAVLSPAAIGRRTSACLVEVDYLSNARGEQRLRDPGERAAIGTAIAGAIREHIGAQRYGREHESDTMRMHRQIADDYRRWTHEDRSDSEIVHGEPARRPGLPRLEAAARLEDFTARAREARGSRVPAEFVRRVLTDRAQPAYADVQAQVDAILAAAGDASFMVQMSTLEGRASELLHVIENHFIRDAGISGLDVLGADAAQYRDFHWSAADYPGGPAGSNEGRAHRMHAALSTICPERRANSGADAVITESQFNSSARIRSFIPVHLSSIPAFSAAPAGSTSIPTQRPGVKLLQHAISSFLRMRDAALADGVALVGLWGYRSPETAAANAAASGNSYAVASYSSHILGLALDLAMSTGDQHFLEATTSPMQNVVDMRTSPVYRWMLIRAADHGWYPYTPEPWHWEYNPPGFRDELMADINAGRH
jgi:N-acetylmuramoyl-L-alanine amidase